MRWPNAATCLTINVASIRYVASIRLADFVLTLKTRIAKALVTSIEELMKHIMASTTSFSLKHLFSRESPFFEETKYKIALSLSIKVSFESAARTEHASHMLIVDFR